MLFCVFPLPPPPPLLTPSLCRPLLCPSLLLVSPHLSPRLRLARMNEEMRETEGPLGQLAQSPTEQQYRKCIQEFICLTIDYC